MNDIAHMPIRRTALYWMHSELGARFVNFAGYEMPIHYPAGIIKEHLHTRASAGLFDISHMGQILLRPQSGEPQAVAEALETVAPQDLLNLAVGRQRYALLTNEAGGIRDDLMIANRGDHFQLIVNANCKDDDEVYLRSRLGNSCIVERRDELALLALQGPQAESVLVQLGADLISMRFLDVRDCVVAGIDCSLSRSGYTGEDGFEISVPAADAEALARRLLENKVVAPIGLGARDSLRLEAGLCLYGTDIDTATTPVEAGLEWSIQKSRRTHGSSEGGFPGSDIILRQMQSGAARRRVGLLADGRMPVRGGSRLFAADVGDAPIGRVTSGGFGPSLGMGIAMALVATAHASIGDRVFAEVRERRVPMHVHELPFVPSRYKRI
jgi:aminomethyltransferase